MCVPYTVKHSGASMPLKYQWLKTRASQLCDTAKQVKRVHILCYDILHVYQYSPWDLVTSGMKFGQEKFHIIHVWFKFVVVRTPSRLFTFFILQNTHYCKEWKNREGVCTTLNLTHILLDSKFEALGTIVHISKRFFFNPGDNSTVKWNVIYTPHGISLLCILQNGKSEIIARGVRTTTNLNQTYMIIPPRDFTFHMHMYIAQWKNWNNPEGKGGTYDNKFEPHIIWL